MNLIGTVELSTPKKAVVLLEEEKTENGLPQVKRIECENQILAEIGNKVSLECVTHSNDKFQFIVRFIPLVLILAGIFLSLLASEEIVRFAIIVAGAFVGFLISWILVIILNSKSKTIYKIEKILEE
ncbi:MAG: SoxR reducing system RseC family protein [Clostridia bacterium]